jgi:pimeloyl-ACP methyl ester carboxylesterase
MNPKFKIRWILIGIFFALLGYAGFFFNYHLVYAGIVENVTIQSSDTQLSGVLVKPTTPGPHPGIVLLHGSGSNQTYGKWYYRIHTNVYLRQGFAVLSYNKRGSGTSEIDYRTVTFQDLIDDGIAAVNFLRSQPDINPDQIGLLGISESGWFTPEIAVRAGDIAFIVNRVSPPLPWRTTVLFEFKNELIDEGFSGKELDEILQLQTRIWQFYIDAAAAASFADGPERDAINAILADTQNRPGGEAIFENALSDYNAEEYAARASKYSYDPSPYLEKIDPPMLYILAEKDVNVPSEQSVVVLEQLKREFEKNIVIKVYPEAGHYLYRWDWLPLEGFYVPGYLDLIGSWAADQIRRE